MTTAYVKRHDTARALQDQLLLDGAAINLTGATVSICFKHLVNGTAWKRTATVTSAVTGQVSYTLIPADTETAGDYKVEWEITFSGGTILTVPDNDYHLLRILEDLG